VKYIEKYSSGKGQAGVLYNATLNAWTIWQRIVLVFDPPPKKTQTRKIYYVRVG
jgi:hypothetical protein